MPYFFKNLGIKIRNNREKIEPIVYIIPTAFSLVRLSRKLEFIYAGIEELNAKIKPTIYKVKSAGFFKFESVFILF